MDAKNRTVTQAVEREALWRHYRKNSRAFIESNWQIKQPRKGSALMKLWPRQIELLDWYESDWENYISLKARQLGWTTTTTAWIFHGLFFEEATNWLFVSQTQGDAIRNLGMVKYGYTRLPEWIKERGPELVTMNTEFLTFDNESGIESIPATGGSGRGDAVAGVMWDEAAFAPDPEGQWAALDALSYWKTIVLSTANGYGNWFQQTYADSEIPGSEWTSKFIPWWERPGRDEAWYDKQVRKHRATPWIVAQEYPRNPQEAFVKSGRNPIDFDLLEEHVWEEPNLAFEWNGHRFEELKDVFEDVPLRLDVWELPTVERDERLGYALRSPNYVIFADLAEGVTDGDYTAVTVYDANRQTCVARIETHFHIEQIAEVLDALGRWYHMALLAVERNQHGWGVLHYLNTVLNYPRLYTMPRIANRRAGHQDVLGWHTNTATKPKMVRDFARALRDHKIEARDPKLRQQLMVFVQDDKGRYGASAGNHDDVVIAHMGALQVIEDAGRFPIIWRDTTHGPLTMGDLDKIAFGGPPIRGLDKIGRGNERRSTRSFEVPMPVRDGQG